jgi:hypothetical protein
MRRLSGGVTISILNRHQEALQLQPYAQQRLPAENIVAAMIISHVLYQCHIKTNIVSI